MKHKIKQIISLLCLCVLFTNTVFAADVNTVQYTSSQITSGAYKEPTRDGYTFAGWYYDKDCTDGKEFDPSKDVPSIKKNTRVYAKWVDQTNPTLNVAETVELTKNGTITVSGTATDAAGIKTLTVNGTTVTVGTDGAFSHTVTLTEGSNTITIVATDNTGNKTTVTRTVVYDKTNPTLTVNNISTSTTNNKVTVSGTVTDTNGIKTLTINGTEVTVGSNGSFSKEITLSEGNNTIKLVATDNAGNQTTVTKSVIYDKTAPTLTVTAPTGTEIGIPTYANNATYTISGKATDTNGVANVTINGESATVGNDGTFSKTVELDTTKTNEFVVVATDTLGNATTLTRYTALRIEATYDANGGTFDNGSAEVAVFHLECRETGRESDLIEFEKGMTWEQFVNSPYNNGDFSMTSEGYVNYSGFPELPAPSIPNKVTKSDIIISTCYPVYTTFVCAP